MKVYVDELPKSCLECACRNGEYNRCELITPEHSIGYYNEEEMDYKDVPINQDFEELECPLQSLADYNKQVKKEMCDEIKRWCDKNFNWVGDGVGYDGQDYNEMIGSNNTIDKLRKLLDQIQGETNG